MKVLKVTIIALCIIAMFAILGNYETHYTMRATVYNVSETGTVFKDNTGNYWEIFDTNYTKGENVKLYFFDNATSDRKDDIIDKVIK